MSTDVVLSTKGYENGEAQWSLCMNKAGYPFSSTAGSVEHFQFSQSQQPKADQQHAAISEARCVDESHLGSIAHAIVTTTNKSIDLRFRHLINEYTQTQQNALSRAREILASN
jgi:hypothetical protein